jgi:hypothetical protein
MVWLLLGDFGLRSNSEPQAFSLNMGTNLCPFNEYPFFLSLKTKENKVI